MASRGNLGLIVSMGDSRRDNTTCLWQRTFLYPLWDSPPKHTPGFGKRLFAITNPIAASAQESARCSDSCAQAFVSVGLAESQRAAPPLPVRYSGPRFRHSNGPPTQHH